MRLCTRNQTLQRCSASTYPTSDPCRTERWRRELNRGRPWSQLTLLGRAIGIASVTLVSVLERVGEIGLRRAVGATRRHIAAQFLAESAAMGLVGGLIGASIGGLIIVAVAAARQWAPSSTHRFHSPHPTSERQPDSSQASTHPGAQHPSNPSPPSEPACEPHPALRQTRGNRNLDDVSQCRRGR